MLDPFEKQLCEYVATHQDRLVALARDLVRLPSENTPPTGAEAACQRYSAEVLRGLGWDVRLYEPTEAAGIEQHPLYWPGRDYRGRPNLGARRRGAGGGRSLALSGHIDTVPRGTLPWTRDPFGGEVEGNRLYGRGSNDMKGGAATNLFVAEALSALGIQLRGDLTVEAVVDEEFGGVNGTLAGRLMGFNADAAVISEPTWLRVCPAQRGGMTAHITLRAAGGILDKNAAGVVEQLRLLLDAVPAFAASRRARAPVPPLYQACPDPVPVGVLKVSTGPFTFHEPMGNPEVCQVELFWQAMPGESEQEMAGQFRAWLDGLIEQHPEAFPGVPEVQFPLRWLPGAFTPESDPLVTELAACAGDTLGAPPPIQGIEGPCDMYVFREFGMPAALWGARGGATHGSDEYVEIDTLVQAACTLLVFVCRWCGVRE